MVVRIVIGLVLTVAAFALAGRRLWWLARVGRTGQPAPERIAAVRSHPARDAEVEATEVGAAVPPAQIFIDALGKSGGLLLLGITIGAQFFCGMSSVTANSRMIYAFSRDGAVPGAGCGKAVERAV